MFTSKLDELLARRLGSSASQKQKAELCGLQYEFFRQIMNQTRNPPSDDKIMEISNNLGLNDDEAAELIILAVKDRAKEQTTKNVLEKVLNDIPKNDIGNVQHDPFEVVEKHTIPIYSTIKAGVGEMGIDGEIVGEVSIDDEYKKQKVFAVRVSGNSMEPEIFDGEIAIFKPVNGEARKDRDIFAVEVEGWASWVIKYVREDPSGMIQLISANQAYQVKEIDPKVCRVTLRGKLIESRRLRK